MAIQFLGSKYKSFKNDGSVNAGGTLEFFEPGGTFSVYQFSFSDSSLSTPNTQVITLDSAGEADVWLGTTVDVRIKDSEGVTIDTFLNWNPTTVTVQKITTPTTLTISSSGKIIRTTATLTLPTASTLTQGWNVYIKNVDTANVTIARNLSSDTINNTAANFTLFPNHSVWIIVNELLNGFDVLLTPFTEIGTGSVDQFLSYGANGPLWVTANLRTVGNKIYLSKNFT